MPRRDAASVLAAKSSSRKPRRAAKSAARVCAAALEELECRRLMSGTLTLVNPDSLPANNRLIFNVIQHPNTTTPNATDSTQTLTLENTGATPLTINSITTSGPFSITSGPTAGQVISAGGSASVVIAFTQATLPAHSVNETNYTTDPNGGAVIDGSLVISSSDSAAPTQSVTLAGYWQNESENNTEPNLTTIVNSLAGYQTEISSSYMVDLPDGSSTSTYYGSEVVSSNWAAAVPGTPITLQTLADFHTQGNIVNTYWYTTGSTGEITSHKLTTSLASEGQTLLPHKAGGGLSAAMFTTASPFGFRVDNEYSNDAVNVADNDGGGGGHHFRFYPLVTSSGQVVANTYIVAMDYAVIQTENFDFQDNVFIVSNIRPYSYPPTPTNLTATSAVQPALSWSAVTYSNLGGYDVLRSTSPTTGFIALNSTPITATAYTDTTAPVGQTLYYEVTSVDNVTSQQSTPSSATANTPAGPTAVADSFSAFSGQATPYSVLGNDTDSSGTIDPSSVLTTTPAHGTVTMNNTTGAVIYTSTSGYSGADSFTYTERDSNGVTSAPATVTVNVVSQAVSSPIGVADTALILENTATAINVLANDEPVTAFNTAAVKLGSLPSHGSASVNSDGTIEYTPTSNYVGSDSFTYTAPDDNGRSTSSTTVSVNVGVAVANIKGANRNVNYTDGDGTPVVIALTRGTADVFFSGNGTTSTIKGKFTVTKTGTGLSVADITMTGTTAASTLNITSSGGTVNVYGINDTAAIGAINARTTNFQGALVAGALSSLVLKNVTSSTFNIGTSLHGPAITMAQVMNSSLNSSGPIRSLRATDWLNTTNGTFGVNATNLGSLAVSGAASIPHAGEFDPSLNLTGSGVTLSSATVTSLGTGFWNVNGAARTVVIGTTGSQWGGSFGSLGSLTIRSGGLADDISSTGAVGTITVHGDLTGAISGTTAKLVHITGAVTDTSLDFSGGVGAVPALGSLVVGGVITGTTINTAGNINAVTASSLVSSSILVDTTATDVSNATAGNIGTGTLRSLHLTSQLTSVFSDSNVIADNLLSVVTGQVNANNGGAPEGIAAAKITSATIGSNGGSIHLPAKDLIDAAVLSTYLQSKGYSFGSFEIVIV